MKLRLDDLTLPELRLLTNRVGMSVKRVLPPESGFVCLFWDFTKQGVGQYVSNARREDMVKFLRETADRLERMEDSPR